MNPLTASLALSRLFDGLFPWVDRIDYHEDTDGPMVCHDCGRPALYDYADKAYHHAVDAERGCFLIPAEDRSDDRSHPLVMA